MIFSDQTVTESYISSPSIENTCLGKLGNAGTFTQSSSNPELVSTMQLEKRVAAFAKHLASNQEVIAAELSVYQSYVTSKDELRRIIDCLSSLQELYPYLGQRTQRVCVFLPLNLPVYSLTLFGVIPSLIADAVYVRPPYKMTTIFRRLLTVLNISFYFPNIHTTFDSKEDFMKRSVAQADVTIFTGKEKNARHVLSKIKRDSLFIFNGWGCNPIVVNSDADLEIAVAKTIEAKLFNSGQDCAGPDTILIHRDIAHQFVGMLKDQLRCVKVGDYTDPDVTVGKIAEEGRLSHLSTFLLKNQPDIVYGGCVDYQKGIVHPTVIVSSLAKKKNYEEFFSPIFFVSIFDDDQQLAAYFGSPQYSANEMYVSLFGSSFYVENLKRSILIRNNTIFDVERGNDAYGGMSLGASFVASQGRVVAKPILVPREISEFLASKAIIVPRLTSGHQKRIYEQASKAIADCFGSNLVFGFVFGSVAKGCATHKSDIDTLVVVENQNAEQSARYRKWIGEYHQKMDMVVDEMFPAEIVTLKFLEEAIASLETIVLNLEHTDIRVFDIVLLTVALSGCKRGIVGNQELLFEYAKKVGKYPKLWKHQILYELEKSLKFAGPIAKERQEKSTEQLKKILQMDPALVLKRFIGLEHLSAEQRHSAHGLIHWDNDRHSIQFDSHALR